MDKKRLEHMKECLVSIVETEMSNIGSVDTKELGEAIDMIKDLEEAIYYCTITEAMKSQEGEQYFMDGGRSRMYNSSGDWSANSSHYYSYPMYRDAQPRDSQGRFMSYQDSNNNSNNSNGSGNRYMDPMEGRSHWNRKMYMESKYNGNDKVAQLRELEKYMQELSSDITEMIADASPEERQYLEKKLNVLSGKISQMK